jgi:RNA polymerase sigma-70 factor (ECF subfamily)
VSAPLLPWARALTPAFTGALAQRVTSREPPSHTEWRLARSPDPSAPESPAPPSKPGTESAAPAAKNPPLAPADSEATDAANAARAYQLWRDRVWRFSSRLGVPPEALEDATQDVFTAVCRRWGDFRGLSTRRTWVLGFVPRVASKYRRRHARRPEQPAEPASLEQASARAEHDPFESAARREASCIVQSFLDGLRDRDRQLFVLVDLEGESVVEAAAILELGTRPAYKCLERIRRDLEACLARHRAGDRRRLR